MQAIRDLCGKNEYNPGLSGLMTNSFYFARLGLFDAIAARAGHVYGRTLDAGRGSKPHTRLFVTEDIGRDMDQSGHRDPIVSANRADPRLLAGGGT